MELPGITKSTLVMGDWLSKCLVTGSHLQSELDKKHYYLYEGAIPEARVERDDCITVQPPQGAPYLHTVCPFATRLSIKRREQ